MHETPWTAYTVKTLWQYSHIAESCERSYKTTPCKKPHGVFFVGSVSSELPAAMYSLSNSISVMAPHLFRISFHAMESTRKFPQYAGRHERMPYGILSINYVILFLIPFFRKHSGYFSTRCHTLIPPSAFHVLYHAFRDKFYVLIVHDGNWCLVDPSDLDIGFKCVLSHIAVHERLDEIRIHVPFAHYDIRM